MACLGTGYPGTWYIPPPEKTLGVSSVCRRVAAANFCRQEPQNLADPLAVIRWEEQIDRCWSLLELPAVLKGYRPTCHGLLLQQD